MKINIITAIPEYLQAICQSSILGRALAANKYQLEILCLRDFADGNLKKKVDDAPYGGGAGMILKIEPIDRALTSLRQKNELGHCVLTSSKGEVFQQVTAQAWSQLAYLTIICGHYEGVDHRVSQLVDEEISLGQFILTGGEPAAAAMIDATLRLLPGVLGNSESLKEESFNDNYLEYPQYTRPENYQGMKVPEVLLSGNHQAIKQWRESQQIDLSNQQIKPQKSSY